MYCHALQSIYFTTKHRLRSIFSRFWTEPGTWRPCIDKEKIEPKVSFEKGRIATFQKLLTLTMVCSPSCYWILVLPISTKGRESLLAMTTTAALRLHVYFRSSPFDELDDEFGKLVHPKWWMDQIRQNQFEALSFLRVTSANTLLPHSLGKYLKRLWKQPFYLALT